MLFSAAQRRIARRAADDLERATLAVNNGLVITRDKEALRRFERGRAARSGGLAESGQSVAEFRSTLGRLGALFPAAVKVH